MDAPSSPKAPSQSLAPLTSLLILPILSGLLYFIGNEYHQSRLNGFGVEASLFTLSIDQAIYNGFTASFFLIGKPILYGFLVAFTLFTLYLLIALLYTSLSEIRNAMDFISMIRKAKLEQYRKKNPPLETVVKATDRASLVFYYAMTVTSLYISVLIYALFSSDLGMKQAEENKENWKLGKTISALVVPAAAGSTPFKALQVQCNDKHCAFWNGQSSEVFRLDQIAKITAFPRTSK